jgi:hypothetical protein
MLDDPAHCFCDCICKFHSGSRGDGPRTNASHCVFQYVHYHSNHQISVSKFAKAVASRQEKALDATMFAAIEKGANGNGVKLI